jgi:hypothetical protein
VIDDQGAAGSGVDRAGILQDAAHIGIVAEAAQHCLAVRDRCTRIGRALTPVPRAPGVRPLGGPVVDSDLVSGRREMTRHRPAHHAQPQECDTHHTLLLTIADSESQT